VFYEVIGRKPVLKGHRNPSSNEFLAEHHSQGEPPMSDLRQPVRNDLVKLLSDYLDVAEEAITPELRLKKDLGVDSLDMASILMRIEEEMGVSIPDDELLDSDPSVEQMIQKIEEINERVTSKSNA
jgi:acyl carrier protein